MSLIELLIGAGVLLGGSGLLLLGVHEIRGGQAAHARRTVRRELRRSRGR